MREINNNAAGLNKPTYATIQEPKKESQTVVEPKNEQTSVTTSETLSKSPEAIIGRSQVIDAKSKALQLSEVEKDVNAMLKNPEIAKEYNKIFDLSLDVLTKQGDKEAYEKSTLIADAYCKEFHQAG